MEYQPTTSSFGKTFLSVHGERQGSVPHEYPHQLRTLLLLLHQEGVVELRHVVEEAVVLNLEGVADLHCARRVRAQEQAQHARRVQPRQLRLEAARQCSERGVAARSCERQCDERGEHGTDRVWWSLMFSSTRGCSRNSMPLQRHAITGMRDARARDRREGVVRTTR